MLTSHLRRVPLNLYLIAAILLILGAVWLLPSLPEVTGAPPDPAGRSLIYLGLAGTVVVLGVVAVAAGLVLTFRPHWHPDRRFLARYGPPAKVLAAVDQELADRASVLTIGQEAQSFQLMTTADGRAHKPVYVTRSWLLRLGTIGFELAHLDEVQRASKHVMVFVAPVAGEVRRDCTVFVELLRGGSLHIPLAETDADTLVRELNHRAFGAPFGNPADPASPSGA